MVFKLAALGDKRLRAACPLHATRTLPRRQAWQTRCNPSLGQHCFQGGLHLVCRNERLLWVHPYARNHDGTCVDLREHAVGFDLALVWAIRQGRHRKSRSITGILSTTEGRLLEGMEAVMP